ncbi:hypothetical protein PoB_006396600 [Plakobranchus ocellatus]|uniref:Uncharacterized protein n=1 Tax=Plakobranchus ocellatus TaxID=259542 RepID=A0AAV4D066_9GAST|nr:hypothetical protein PoB_006396600 [Plakobranchus ocellatus]
MAKSHMEQDQENAPTLTTHIRPCSSFACATARAQACQQVLKFHSFSMSEIAQVEFEAFSLGYEPIKAALQVLQHCHLFFFKIQRHCRKLQQLQVLAVLGKKIRPLRPQDGDFLERQIERI